MALDERDLALIRQVVVEQLAVVQVSERKRRRFWLWFWVWFFILTTAAGTWWSWKVIEKVQAQIAAQDQAFQETKRSYQAELARNQEWQNQREQAEKAVGYQSNRSQPSHEAMLMNNLMSLMSKQGAMKEKWANADLSDPEDLNALADDMNQVLTQGLGTIMQVMLRNTDPAHNTAQERMLQDLQPTAEAPLVPPPPAAPVAGERPAAPGPR
jgi:hypothetical protein